MASQSTLSRSKFNELLLESIDETLSSLGESPKTAIYSYLEKSFDIKKQEIPNKTSAFSTALRKLFGSGAKHLEVLTMQKFYVKLRGCESVPAEQSLFKVTFIDYVRFMRHNFEETSHPEIEIRILANEREELQ
jgi:hypothetical protein